MRRNAFTPLVRAKFKERLFAVRNVPPPQKHREREEVLGYVLVSIQSARRRIEYPTDDSRHLYGNTSSCEGSTGSCREIAANGGFQATLPPSRIQHYGQVQPYTHANDFTKKLSVILAGLDVGALSARSSALLSAVPDTLNDSVSPSLAQSLTMNPNRW